MSVYFVANPVAVSFECSSCHVAMSGDDVRSEAVEMFELAHGSHDSGPVGSFVEQVDTPRAGDLPDRETKQ